MPVHCFQGLPGFIIRGTDDNIAKAFIAGFLFCKGLVDFAIRGTGGIYSYKEMRDCGALVIS